jgi:hypothetical protein
MIHRLYTRYIVYVSREKIYYLFISHNMDAPYLHTRWKQRYQNYESSLRILRGILDIQINNLSPIEIA